MSLRRRWVGSNVERHGVLMAAVSSGEALEEMDGASRALRLSLGTSWIDWNPTKKMSVFKAFQGRSRLFDFKECPPKPCLRLKRAMTETLGLAAHELPELRVALLANRAEAFLRLERFEDCCQAARAALSLRPSHAKAKLRLAKASALLAPPRRGNREGVGVSRPGPCGECRRRRKR